MIIKVFESPQTFSYGATLNAYKKNLSIETEAEKKVKRSKMPFAMDICYAFVTYTTNYNMDATKSIKHQRM